MSCREIGNKKRRKEWEQRTGYAEKQKLMARKNRCNKPEAGHKKKSEQKDSAKNQKQEKLIKNNLEQRANEGDLYALGILALKRGDVLEYWRLRKEKYIAEDERTGRTGDVLVGGISPYSDNFEHYVLDQIKDGKRGR